MRLLVLATLLLATSTACAGNPAVVDVGEGGVTVRYLWMTYEFPLDYVALRGYENIPTPTPDPARLPTLTPSHPQLTPTPTADSTPNVPAMLSTEEFFDDHTLAQHLGRRVSLLVTVGGFRESWGSMVLWNDIGTRTSVATEIGCHFPDGWARTNVERLETWTYDWETVVVATGKLLNPEVSRLGSIGAEERARSSGLQDCIFEPITTPIPTPTPIPVLVSSATLTADEWYEDSTLSLYFGQIVAVEGTLGEFRHHRGLVWVSGDPVSVGIAGVICHFYDGWAAANEDFLWDLRESETTVRATGRLIEPTKKIGVQPAEQARSTGLYDCTLDRIN